MRRKRGQWMNKAADPVLEFLDEHNISVPIGVLDNELPPSYMTINRALTDLENHGLIERDPDYESYRRITDLGRAYLDGEVDADNLELEE